MPYSLLRVFRQSLARFPLHPGDKIVVAVSGGADSVCLLHLLRQTDFPLQVAHLNHQFRGSVSADDATFVESLSALWNIPCTLSSVPVENLCKVKGLSKQAGAREIRYQFLKEVAYRTGARWITTGHTADDQAETFLMRLLRGAGAEGLGGIRSMRDGQIIRPLLSITRAIIMEELARERIAYREDASNASLTYFRNQVRRDVMPLLTRYNPQITRTLCRTSALLYDDNDCLATSLQSHLPDIVVSTTHVEIALDIKKLQSLHRSLQRRAVRWAIGQLRGTQDISLEFIESVLCFCSTHKMSHPLPRPLNVNTNGSYLVIGLRDAATA